MVADELVQINDRKELSYTDAEFLLELGNINAAESYLLKHAAQLNGDMYGSLLPLAEAMALENRPLLASLIYRALLASILKRGYTKAYPHGVGYLKKLDRLAMAISDWQAFEHHEAFKAQIIKTHGLKHSFWSKYQDKKKL